MTLSIKHQDAFVKRFDSLVDMYTQSINSFSDKPFIGEKKNGQYCWTSYGEFDQLVAQARGVFSELGLSKGDRIALISDNCLEWVVTAFGAYTLGVVVVPMYEAQKASEWEFIINDCQAKIICTRTKANADIAKDIATRVNSVTQIVQIRDDDGIADGVESLSARSPSAPDVEIVTITGEDIAGFIYTSGTTGNPKGVQLSHQNLADNLSAFNQVLPMDVEEGETSLAFLPWAHVFGQVVELYGLFSGGGRLALSDPKEILDNLLLVKPTILYSVPRVWNRIYTKLNNETGLKGNLIKKAIEVQEERFSRMKNGQNPSPILELQFKVLDGLVLSKVREKLGGNLKYAVSGSAALSPEVANFVAYLGIVVSEGYGLTETSPIATYNPVDDPRAGTVGIPVPGVEIRIDPVADAPKGQGEIIIFGHNVMQGYYHRDDENSKVFTEDGGLRSGDLGMIVDGYLKITGRVKEQYKLENGKYVAPAPLEEAVKLSSFIANCFLYGMNKGHNVALIVPDAEALMPWARENGLGGQSMQQLCETQQVRQLVQREIDNAASAFKGYEKIREFALVAEEFTTENGMLTPSMKIKRRAVLETYGGVIEGLYQ